MKKIVTHGTSRFHTDDVFAVAALDLFFKGDIEIIRTADPEIIQSGDVVVDIGGEYDPEKNRFDHHQRGGSGERENGIQYASIGLVWKHYGEMLCGSAEASDVVDKKLIQSIDAGDNGQSLFDLKMDSAPYLIQNVVNLYRDYEGDEARNLEQFKKAVEFAKFVLEKEIADAKNYIEAKRQADSIYESSADKRVIVFEDEKFSSGVRARALMEYPEPIYVIYPDSERGSWRVKGVNKADEGFETKKPLPEVWGGLYNEELQSVSGVADAMFCHRGLFTCAAASKEGALQMAQKALENNN